VFASGLALVALLLAAVLSPSGGNVVSGQTSPTRIQDLIDEAQPGDIVYVEAGIYHERIVINKEIALKGVNDPVIDGGDEGDVVLIEADGAAISGFVIRNGGKAISQEAAGVKVDGADRVEVMTNRIEDTRFGIYLVDSEASTLAYNTIDLQPDVDIARRGYAIYLWEVERSGIFNNVITNAADGIHLEFSRHNTIGENEVTDSRYGLHSMYSDGNKIVSNLFRNNLAGAVNMFSHDTLLKDNVLSGNRKGAIGVGVLFKDSNNVFVEGNEFLRNRIGVTVEGTPQAAGATAIFRENLFALNDTGIGLMSNAPITFVENAMIENPIQVTALGGDLASGLLSSHGDGLAATDTPAGTSPEPPAGITWTLNGRGNYWSDYQGYDRNGDGVGDVPYAPKPSFAGGLDDNPALRFFQFTLAQEAIDAAADMFPFYRYDAVMEDGGPLMSPPGPALSKAGAFNSDLLVASGALVIISLLILQAILEVDLRRTIRGALGRTVSEGRA
jgi:nitrous oxidase accessory protein